MKNKRAVGSVPLPSGLPPSGDELLHFFDESFDPLCIVGLDGMFKHLNPAWQPVLGWTPADLQSRPFLDFVHPDDRAATYAEVGKLAEGAERRIDASTRRSFWVRPPAGVLALLG